MPISIDAYAMESAMEIVGNRGAQQLARMLSRMPDEQSASLNQFSLGVGAPPAARSIERPARAPMVSEDSMRWTSVATSQNIIPDYNGTHRIFFAFAGFFRETM